VEHLYRPKCEVGDDCRPRRGVERQTGCSFQPGQSDGGHSAVRRGWQHLLPTESGSRLINISRANCGSEKGKGFAMG
jgi:hypothetical protein